MRRKIAGSIVARCWRVGFNGKSKVLPFPNAHVFQERHVMIYATYTEGATNSDGGGNSSIFNFHPEPWENDPIWRAYLFKGVESTN